MEESSRTGNSMRNIASSFVMQLLQLIFRFAAQTVFIHTLGKEYLGISGLMTDILTMLSLSELGFDTAIHYKLYKPLAEKNEKRIRSLMRFYKQVYTGVGLVILMLGICVFPFLRYLTRDFPSEGEMVIGLVFGLHLLQSVSSYLFLAYQSAIVKADQKMYLLNVVGCGIVVLSHSAQILILLTTRSFVLFTAVVVLFNILQNLLNAGIARKYYPQVFRPEAERISREEAKELFKDCGAMFLHKVNGVALKSTDSVILSAFLGLGMTGRYTNYALFYTTIKSILLKFYDAVKASMGNFYTTEELSRRYAFFEVMNFLTVILYGTAGVGVAAVADALICQWVGQDYMLARPFSVLMGLEILLMGLKNNLVQVRNVTGIFRKMWIRPLLGILVNLAVSIALVQKWGVCGVLAGTIASDVLTFFLMDPWVIHKYSFQNHRPVRHYYRKTLAYTGVLCVIGAADIWLCGKILTGLGWFSVGVHIVLCGLSVPAGFLLLYWRSEECRYLRKLAGRIWKKMRKQTGSGK